MTSGFFNLRFAGALFAVLAVTVFHSSPLFAVDCSGLSISLESQAQVDSFQTDYGGGGTCDTVVGHLYIGPSTDIVNLNPLSDLTTLGGGLIVQENDVLQNLDGLNAVTSMSGHLLIQTNTALQNIDGLSGLTSGVLGLVVTDNLALTNVDGFSGLTTMAGHLTIDNNPALENVDGFSSLTGGVLQFLVTDNTALTNVDGFASLISVSVNVTMLGNSSLSSCGGLQALLDDVDDGDPGPGPGGAGIPDVGGTVSLSGNLRGCNSVGEILQQIDLELVAADMPDPVLAGSGPDNLTHTLQLQNLGPWDATGVSVSVATSLPAGVAVTGSSASLGSFDGSTWTVGDMAFGSNPETLTINLTVDASAQACTDCVAAAGTASANEEDTNENNNTDISNPTSIELAAAAPTSFLTTIGFTNGYEGTVTVTISCNNGTPLEQSFDISPSQPVDFVVDLLDFVAPNVGCTISLDSVDDGYVGSFLANGVDTGDACVYASEPEPGEAPFDVSTGRANTCEITAEPVVSTFAVDKVWVFENNDVVEMSAGIHIWCSPAAEDTGPEFGTVQTWVTAYGDDSFTLPFYPDWDGGATCYAQESDLDSAVESDAGCADGTAFEVGDETGGCTITNTVFFEGIPTLNQYGLALLALLMLGVGFVGLRRLV